MAENQHGVVANEHSTSTTNTASNADVEVVLDSKSSAELALPKSKSILKSRRQFFLLKIDFEEDSKLPAAPVLNRFNLKQHLNDSVRSMFGVIGAARWDVDVLSIDSKRNTAVVCCEAGGAIGVRAALAMNGKFGDRIARTNVVKSSPFLMSLAADSRRIPEALDAQPLV